jgi:hypothetical protein
MRGASASSVCHSKLSIASPKIFYSISEILISTFARRKTLQVLRSNGWMKAICCVLGGWTGSDV